MIPGYSGLDPPTLEAKYYNYFQYKKKEIWVKKIPTKLKFGARLCLKSGMGAARSPNVYLEDAGLAVAPNRVVL